MRRAHALALRQSATTNGCAGFPALTAVTLALILAS